MHRGDVDFRISGADEHDLRRWRREAASRATIAGGVPAISMKALSVVAILWAAPALTMSDTPSIEQNGQTITGGRVLLIQDGSGSMGAYAAVAASRLAALRAASAYSGFACLTGNTEFLDFVECAVREARRGDVDAFYVFGDFQWAGVNDASIAQVRQALEPAGIRLYLETVGGEPDARLAALAASTGGAVIHTPR